MKETTREAISSTIMFLLVVSFIAGVILAIPWFITAIAVSTAKATGWYCQSSGRVVVYEPTGMVSGSQQNAIKCIYK